jgi:2-haloacid dehalogenase
MASHLKRIRAVVFDAYGTLLDVGSAANRARDVLGATWQPLADTWRAKQLQYTWLRSLMGRHTDFWQVTGDALDFAMEAHRVSPGNGLRDRLMQLYRVLDAYPDARPVLATLREAGISRAILSNGEPTMLADAARSAGLDGLLDAILSVEDVGVYKPHPRVYELAPRRFGVTPAEIAFISSNGWDAYGAKAFGFRVVWCNRAGGPRERIPAEPDVTVNSLADLPALILGAAT